MAEKIKRILIVDNDETRMLFFKVLFLDHQISGVIESINPKTALSTLEPKRIQLSLICWEMQPINGNVLIQRIRAKRKFKHLPCIIYSSKLTDDDIALATELGFTNLLRYPLEKDQAWKAISDVIEKEENLDEGETNFREAEVQFLEKNYDLALNIAGKVPEDHERGMEAKVLQAEIQMGMEDFEAAEKTLQATVARDPDFYPAQQMMSVLYRSTNRYKEAIATLTKMVENSPLNLDNLLRLGDAYVDDNQLDKAKECYSEVEDTDPDNPRVREGKGKVAFKEGDTEGAAEFFAEIENGEEVGRFFNNCGVGYVASGKFEEGIKTYKSAISIMKADPALKFLRYNLGLVMRKTGMLKEAFDILSQCYLENPEYLKAYAATARVAKEMKKKNIEADKDVIKAVNEAFAAQKEGG